MTVDTIEQILQNKDCFLSKETLSNICRSFLKIYPDDHRVFDCIFKLYKICNQNHYIEEIVIIMEALDSCGLRIDLFRKYIELEEKLWICSGDLVDDTCLDFFIEEYKKGKYEDQLADEILRWTNIGNKNYKVLNDIYCKKTNISFLENRNSKQIKPGCSKQDFFNCLFSKQDFINCFEELKKEVGVVKISSEYLSTLNWDVFQNNEKLEKMKFFLHRFSRDKDFVI